MQKKLIVLALAGLTAAPAFAQSNVTVYGRVDYGYMSRGGNDGLVDVNGRKGEMDSGIQSGSRLGFKGSEDLGNGLKAIFEIESGVRNDAPNASSATQSGGIFSTSRHAYVGLTGNFGTVVGGRLDGVRYGIYNKYDAFGGGGMGNFTQMTQQVDRADNAIAYISPKWNGFGLVLAHARDVAGQEVNGSVNTSGGVAGATKANAGDGRLYTIMGTYDNGPLSLSLDYEAIKFAHSSNAAAGADDAYVATVGGSYDFGMVKLSALYDIHRADGNRALGTNVDAVDYNAWFVSAKVPYGKFDFKATYGRISDKRNASDIAALGGTAQVLGVATTVVGDASKFGIGVNYNLSKRTNIYADYARISNDSNANYMLSPAANSQGGGYGVSGFNVGLAHNF
jgi:predicted porin